MFNRLLRAFFPAGEARQGEATAAVAEARALADANRPAEAIELLGTHLSRHPEDAEGRFLRGTLLLEMERTAEALPDLQRACREKPGEQRYLHNLAMAHWTRGDIATATALCDKALAMGDFRPAHILRAKIDLPGEDYLELMARMHQHIRPATYVEIGVNTGQSLQLVRPETRAIGVDPAPKLAAPPPAGHTVYAETSDAFFARHDVVADLGGRRIDMAFIDGMHHFEFALRDFINIERLARRDSVVLLHDCYPLDASSAAREPSGEHEPSTQFWSGDVWRLVLILKKYRPDLHFRTLGVPPTGLGMILNLDPGSRVLSDRLESIVEEFKAADYATIEGRKSEALNLASGQWEAVRKLLDERPR